MLGSQTTVTIGNYYHLHGPIHPCLFQEAFPACSRLFFYPLIVLIASAWIPSFIHIPLPRTSPLALFALPHPFRPHHAPAAPQSLFSLSLHHSLQIKCLSGVCLKIFF